MEKQKNILVVIKEPGKAPYVEPCFPNTLEAFQKAVGGYIETLTLCEDLVMVVNEEGLLQGLPYNCKVCGRPFVGTIVAVGVKEDEFASIHAAHVPTVLKLFKEGSKQTAASKPPMKKKRIIGTAKLREKSGMTQKALGKIVGKSQQTVAKWETGASEPDIETMFTLAAVFGCTIEELFEEEIKNGNAEKTSNTD